MEKSCTVSLIAFNSTLEPDALTEQFQIQPTWTKRIGEPFHPGDLPNPYGYWKVSAVGPTPVNAPLLANDLVRGLLDRMPKTDAWSQLCRDGDVEVQFTFVVPPLLIFSYELDASVFQRLAELEAPLDFCQYGTVDVRRPRRYGSSEGQCWECKVDLTRSPYAEEAESPTDVNDLARTLLERLAGPAAGQSTMEIADDAKVRFTFMLTRMTGYFRIEPDIVRRIAALGRNVMFFFYNEGP